MKTGKLRIGLVGLGFGLNYLGSYLKHPDVTHVGLCDISKEKLRETGRKHGIERLYSSLEDMIDSGEFDAIHLMTQIPDHAEQAVRVLDAGLHCACALPMGVSMEELENVDSAVKRNGCRYMMMEPNAFIPETLYVRDLFRQGEMGRIQYMRGMQTYFLNNHVCPYWRGMPPMHYVSHVLTPLLVITNSRVKAVRCLGSGWMKDELRKVHGNPFPIETALMELDMPSVLAEIIIQFFETAVMPKEGFDVYGEKMSFKWPELPGEKPILLRLVDPHGYFSNEVVSEYLDVPDLTEHLSQTASMLSQTEPSRFCGLVDEFVRCILEDRESLLGLDCSFNITGAGILAHRSAMQNGVRIEVPETRCFEAATA